MLLLKTHILKFIALNLILRHKLLPKALNKHVCCWDEFIAGASCYKCNLIPSALLLLASIGVGKGREIRVQQHGSEHRGDLRIV